MQVIDVFTDAGFERQRCAFIPAQDKYLFSVASPSINDATTLA
jgi:hypothetical protein